ncbi:putative 5'(3')-deoxyribonucleotidase, partial [termite gut metagenome]
DGQKILFTQPHNTYVLKDYFQRVDNWGQIMNIL